MNWSTISECGITVHNETVLAPDGSCWCGMIFSRDFTDIEAMKYGCDAVAKTCKGLFKTDVYHIDLKRMDDNKWLIKYMI